MTSPTVCPTITSPSCTEDAYDLTSFMRPRMYGSSDSHSFRTNTSPPSGLAMGASTMRKLSSVTAPRGRLASSTCLLTAMDASAAEPNAEHTDRADFDAIDGNMQ